jgi:hypothetical protein
VKSVLLRCIDSPMPVQHLEKIHKCVKNDGRCTANCQRPTQLLNPPLQAELTLNIPSLMQQARQIAAMLGNIDIDRFTYWWWANLA